MRVDGRSTSQLRPIRIVPNFLKYATGSALIEVGETKVLCSVTVEENLPSWMRNERGQKGWLTAEYSMLPGATQTRSKRERSHLGGRTQEIQRLIGRALRAVLDLSKCPDLTFLVDCDVIQADGGTRTAAINGSFVALSLACKRLLKSGKLKQDPIREGLAATSVGLVGGQIVLDLNYSEDSQADLDMNVVLTHSGKIIELQGSAERSAFSREEVIAIIDLVGENVQSIADLQRLALEGRIVES